MYSMLTGSIRFKPEAAPLLNNIEAQNAVAEEDWHPNDWNAAMVDCPLAQVSEKFAAFANSKRAHDMLSVNDNWNESFGEGLWPASGAFRDWNPETLMLKFACAVKDGNGISEFVACLPDLADEWHLFEMADYFGFDAKPTAHHYPELPEANIPACDYRIDMNQH